MDNLDQIKKVPSDLQAEKAVLGGIFLNPDIFDDIISQVKTDDFYKGAHKTIFEAMKNVYNNGAKIDPILVKHEIEKNKKFIDSVTQEDIIEIVQATSTAANLLKYAKVVKEKSILRKLANAGTKIAEMSYEGHENVGTIVDNAESLIFKISENNEKKELVDMDEAIADMFTRLQNVYQNKGIATGISSGYKDFDQMTNGFHNSDLIIIAGRPAMGKTAFVLNLALNAAKKEKNVLVFSLEMGNSQLLERLLAIDSKIPLNRLKNGFLQDDEWKKLGDSCATLAQTNIHIADTANITVLEMRAMARRLKAAGKLDMIIIDYLQLVTPDGAYKGNKVLEVGEISRSLKLIARELDVPIISLAQLSRGTEGRGDKRPMLSDLRDSGAIEQDADVVIFLYREDYYNDESDKKGITEIIIGKQRNGPVGTVELKFFPEYTRFENYAPNLE